MPGTGDYAARNIPTMPQRSPRRPPKTPSQRRRTFITEWREARGLSQEKLAERLGTTAATISRIENRLIGYSQDMLEDIAAELGTTAGTLLTRAPAEIDLMPPPLSAGDQQARRRRN